ncbi:UvrD/REP helicase [Burkholderiales bacterium GJ-E10]|nr:UvrD/REP helicase [Burkholderiales bacterium GJ-E10]
MNDRPAAPRSPGALPAYLERLNEAQRRAVQFGADGEEGEGNRPLLVIAGAGTGKTNTLAHRVAHLLARGGDPGRILLLTFSSRAADEMARRVTRICREALAPSRGAALSLAWAGTFHSVGARLLREYAGRIGIDPAFTIHDREDSADLMNLVRHELGDSTKARRFPMKGTCLAIYSAVVNTRRSLGEVLRTDFPWCGEWEAELKRLFGAYVQAKQSQRVLDFDDLLLYWEHLAQEPQLARELGVRFDHILVDEYQDTNRLQAAILLAMKPDGRGLTVVGDDAQSIYAFRGAAVRNILDFPQCFDPPAERIALERNYRSTQPILNAANAVIALASERHDKDLWTERRAGSAPRLVNVRDEAGQADFVAERVLERREAALRLKSQAVLFRASHHSARLEIELSRRNIPFVKFGGLKFLESAHVKDVLAVLRWARNPRDRVSGFRAIQLLPGIGPKTAERVLQRCECAGAGSAGLASHPVPDGAAPAWREFAALVEGIGSDVAPWPAVFEAVCGWYEAQMERIYEDASARVADIQQLARIAATYPGQQRFLTELTLDPPSATAGEAGAPLLDEDYLILSTIHSAKGREWAAVTVLNAVDGCIPSDLSTGSAAQVEEERRLLYVAMTRARDHLDIVVPQRFYVSNQPGGGDRHVHAVRTRFLPERVLHHFESISWPESQREEPAPAVVVGERTDLPARMRAMWQ